MKARRVNRSVLCTKVMASAEAFDMPYVTKYELQLISGCCIPLSMLADSLPPFDILTKAATTTRKRLRIDLKSSIVL